MTLRLGVHGPAAFPLPSEGAGPASGRIGTGTAPPGEEPGMEAALDLPWQHLRRAALPPGETS